MDKLVECDKVFGSNPKGFELLKTYLAVFGRTQVQIFNLWFVNGGTAIA